MRPGEVSATVGAEQARPTPLDGPAADEPPVSDWTLRPFLATRHSPLWVGLALALALLAVAQLYRLAFETAGRPGVPLLRDPYFWLDGLNGVLFAYIPTALVYLRRGRLRDLRELRPQLDCDDASFQRYVNEALCVPPVRLFASGLVGALLLGAMPLLDPGFWESLQRPPLSDPMMLLLIARSAITGWLGGHAFASEATSALTLSRIGERLRVDLLDPSSLAPFARASQRGAFAWVLISSLVSLFWLGPAAGVSNVLILGAILLLVSASFAFSIHGAHRGIVATKRAALGGLEAQIRARGAALLAGRPAPDGPGMADLVAYHGLLERAREWPLGTPALLRASLIAALAVGSWLGGALVEQLLDRVLH